MADEVHDIFDEAFLRRLQRLEVRLRHVARQCRPGGNVGRDVGDGLEFADHRAYTPGDDVRFVDWAYYARMEKLLLRLFHRHTEADLLLLLDCSASMQLDGTSDLFRVARQLTAALAYIGVSGGRPVYLQPFDNTLSPAHSTGRNREQLAPALEFLAGLTAGESTDPCNVAREVVRRYPRMESIILLSDCAWPTEDFDDALTLLTAHGAEVSVLQLYVPQDAAPTFHGGVDLLEAEGDGALGITATPDCLAAYRRRWAAWRDAQEAVASRRGVRFVSAEGDKTIEFLLFQTLARIGILHGR